MSLDFYMGCRHCGREVFSKNITHNLGKMAAKAGLYEALWRPEEIGASLGKDLIQVLETGLKTLESDPGAFKKLNPENGWGSYEGLVAAVTEVLRACRRYPDAEISVSR